MRRQLLVGVLALGVLVGATAGGVWITNRIGTPASVMPPPVRPPDWTEIVTALAAVIALTSVYFAWTQSRHARHAALMTDLSRRWDEPSLVESRKMATSFADGYELREKIAAEGRDPTDDLFILERIPNFFEDLGVLERVGAVSFHVIAESFGLTVTETWDKCALAVQHLRVKYQDRRVYENFERLAERIRGRVERV